MESDTAITPNPDPTYSMNIKTLLFSRSSDLPEHSSTGDRFFVNPDGNLCVVSITGEVRVIPFDGEVGSSPGPSAFYDIGTFSGEETVNLDFSHGQNQRIQIGSNIALNLPTPSDGQRLVLYVYSTGGAWGFQINGNLYYGLFDSSPKTLTANKWARYEFEYVTSQWNFIGFLSDIIWD